MSIASFAARTPAGTKKEETISPADDKKILRKKSATIRSCVATTCKWATHPILLSASAALRGVQAASQTAAMTMTATDQNDSAGFATKRGQKQRHAPRLRLRLRPAPAPARLLRLRLRLRLRPGLLCRRPPSAAALLRSIHFSRHAKRQRSRNNKGQSTLSFSSTSSKAKDGPKTANPNIITCCAATATSSAVLVRRRGGWQGDGRQGR